MNNLDSGTVVRSSVAIICSHGHKRDVVLKFLRAACPPCNQLHKVLVDGASGAAALAAVATVVVDVAGDRCNIVDLGVVVNAVAVGGGVGCLVPVVVVFVGGKVQLILVALGSRQQ